MDDDLLYWRSDLDVKSTGGLYYPKHEEPFRYSLCHNVERSFSMALDAHKTSDFADQFDQLSLLFVQSAEANAMAADRDNRRAVIISLGLIERVWGYLHYALDCTEFLDDSLGSPVPNPTLSIRNRLQSRRNWMIDPPENWPPDRRLALQDLFMRATTFLTRHELAHLARGHVSYLVREKGMRIVNEKLCAKSIGEGDEIMRSIEFDADFHALDLLALELEHCHGMSDWDQETASNEHFQWSIAIICSFQMFDLLHLPIREQYRSSHPACVHRAMRATHILARLFADEFDWTDDDRIDAHDHAWITASEFAKALRLPEGRWRGESILGMAHDILDIEERRFIAFSERLNEYWRRDDA